METEANPQYVWIREEFGQNSKARVRAALAQAEGPLSGEALSERLGISRTAVWKQIEALRSNDYEITASPKRGYRLERIPDRLYPWELGLSLLESSLGGRIEYFGTVGSTNDVAKQRGSAGAPEGLLVVAESQKGGRGRRGRSWLSPFAQGIWASLLLRPAIDPFAVGCLTLLAAAATAAAIEAQLGLPARIKWPNDVLIDGRKVCGILVELAAELQAVGFVVVGIGLNVRIAEADLAGVSNWAGSLKAFTGKPVDRAALLVHVLRELESRYQRACRTGFAEVIAENRSRSATLGRRVRIEEPHGSWEGTAEAIAEDGALQVRDQAGALRVVRSGEVSVRPGL